MQAFRSFFQFILLTVSLVLSGHAAAKTINHAMGTVEIDGVPQRVVVLGQGSLDVLDRLGVEPVGVVKSLMPDYLAKTYQDDKYIAVGTVKEPDYEAIFYRKTGFDYRRSAYGVTDERVRRNCSYHHVPS